MRAVIVGLLIMGSLVNLLLLVLHHITGASVMDSLWLALLIAAVSMGGLFRLWVRRT